MKNPLVIGYKGEIGSFILSGLLRVMPKALDIWCVDINESEEEVIDRIKKSDFIFVCIPLGETVEWILKFKDLLKDKVIVEQCSLKEWIYEDEKLEGLDIRSMHILFRPSKTPNLEDRTLGLFEGQFSFEMAKTFEKITQAEIVIYENAFKHDKEMAVQQALVHRTLFLLGDALEGCKGSTYVAKKVLELKERVKQGDKNLYALIQDNRHLPEALESLRRGFEEFDINEHMGR